MFKYVIFATILISVVCIGESYGQPEISGVTGAFRDGESVTISGASFGTKAKPDPLFWCDFEKGKLGEEVTTDRNWTETTDNWTSAIDQRNVTYSNENALPGSSLSSRHEMDGDCTQWEGWLARNGYMKKYFAEPMQKVYISFWVRYNHGTEAETHQIKLWRIESHEDEWMTIKNIHYFYNPPLGDVTDGHNYGRQTGFDGIVTSHGYNSLLSPENDAWYQVNFKLLQSSVGVADGSVEIWHSHSYGSSEPFVKVINLPDIVTRSNSNYLNTVVLGEVCTNLSCGVTCDAVQYFDSFYLDNTWARVEIGNAPTWDACTYREVQLPSEWLGSSITVTANTGCIPHGSAYLYVSDAEGVHNTNGYPITIESSPGWLYNVANRWQAGTLTRSDVDRALYWNIKGIPPPENPMAELTEDDLGDLIMIFKTE